MGAVSNAYERKNSLRRDHERHVNRYQGLYALKEEKILEPGGNNEAILSIGTLVKFIDLIAEAHRFEVVSGRMQGRTFDVMPVKVDALLTRLPQ